ncbi:alpha/beta hydrolase [Mycolicibacterium baixiangningiae]|uniref:alpha/beta hydrolase n=1 Tax=Mycolicibacterium baixiangningiae TaxID=2761578 RepID=UPI0018E5B508|nr:alpha/beta hydrolase-fold protein [Mycolicibacterium baixiangningiae]
MLRTGPALLLLLLAVACGMESPGPGARPHLEEAAPATTPADPSGGRLRSRPAPPTLPPYPPGLHEVDTGSDRTALLYVPADYRPDQPAPLVVLLHGAGGDARGGITPLLSYADEAGLILLAPASRRRTWDVIVRSFGQDITALDEGLSHVFARHAVDAERVGIGGFSDGASYALSVGLTNGDLFTDVLGFSPGFSAPGEAVGRPRIYISHGVADSVLPIDRTSRRLLPRLRDAGYEVLYEEFPGGHVVPADRARRALDWFLH